MRSGKTLAATVWINEISHFTPEQLVEFKTALEASFAKGERSWIVEGSGSEWPELILKGPDEGQEFYTNTIVGSWPPEAAPDPVHDAAVSRYLDSCKDNETWEERKARINRFRCGG
jgi:hypothetical protein